MMPLSLLVFLAALGATRASNSCEFQILGDEFREGEKMPDSQMISLEDGTVWWLDEQGLHLSFANQRVLHGVAAQTKAQKKLRLMSFDKQQNVFVIDKTFKTDLKRPMEARFAERPIIRDLLIAGFTKMDIKGLDFITVTACPQNCPPFTGCFGDCVEGGVDGCMRCICPKNSDASGCAGYQDEKDLHLLMALARKHIFGCQFVHGFRRQPTLHPSFAPCVEFNYPLCRWYKPINVPRTRLECEQTCRV